VSRRRAAASLGRSAGGRAFPRRVRGGATGAVWRPTGPRRRAFLAGCSPAPDRIGSEPKAAPNENGSDIKARGSFSRPLEGGGSGRDGATAGAEARKRPAPCRSQDAFGSGRPVVGVSRHLAMLRFAIERRPDGGMKVRLPVGTGGGDGRLVGRQRLEGP